MRSADFSRNSFGCLAVALLIPFAAIGCRTVESRLHNQVGVRLFEEGLYSAAKVSFEQALYQDPNNADTYYNLASALHRMGDAAPAEQYYNQALDRNPNHRRSYHSLAVLLVEQGRRDDAISLLEGWVEDMPAAPQASVELAWLYRYVGDTELAERQLQYALEISPRHGEALAALASIREEQGQAGRALALYERAMGTGNPHPVIAARVARLRAGSPVISGDAEAPTRFVDRTEAPQTY